MNKRIILYILSIIGGLLLTACSTTKVTYYEKDKACRPHILIEDRLYCETLPISKEEYLEIKDECEYIGDTIGTDDWPLNKSREAYWLDSGREIWYYEKEDRLYLSYELTEPKGTYESGYLVFVRVVQ